jgi:hypothetical protein
VPSKWDPEAKALEALISLVDLLGPGARSAPIFTPALDGFINLIKVIT